MLAVRSRCLVQVKGFEMSWLRCCGSLLPFQGEGDDVLRTPDTPKTTRLSKGITWVGRWESNVYLNKHVPNKGLLLRLSLGGTYLAACGIKQPARERV